MSGTNTVGSLLRYETRIRLRDNYPAGAALLAIVDADFGNHLRHESGRASPQPANMFKGKV
jgi:hypothetical protein